MKFDKTWPNTVILSGEYQLVVCSSMSNNGKIKFSDLWIILPPMATHKSEGI